jgi:hypothetical protein
MSGTLSGFGLGIKFTNVDPVVSTTTPEFPGRLITPGTKVAGTSGDEWIYVIAGGSITAGDICLVTTNSSWTVSSMTSALAKGKLGQMVGVAGGTATVGQYLWMQVGGYTASVAATTGQAAFTVLSSTTTAGRIGAASAGNSAKVTGLVLLATAASNVAAAILTNPAVGTDD